MTYWLVWVMSSRSPAVWSMVSRTTTRDDPLSSPIASMRRSTVSGSTMGSASGAAVAGSASTVNVPSYCGLTSRSVGYFTNVGTPTTIQARAAMAKPPATQSAVLG